MSQLLIVEKLLIQHTHERISISHDKALDLFWIVPQLVNYDLNNLPIDLFDVIRTLFGLCALRPWHNKHMWLQLMMDWHRYGVLAGLARTVRIVVYNVEVVVYHMGGSLVQF
jgi:hypothetical protein